MAPIFVEWYPFLGPQIFGSGFKKNELLYPLLAGSLCEWASHPGELQRGRNGAGEGQGGVEAREAGAFAVKGLHNGAYWVGQAPAVAPGKKNSRAGGRGTGTAAWKANDAFVESD